MKTRGFTILEILVVISIIAVLVTIAVPKFKGMQEQGKISKAKSELKTLQAAIESYYIHHSSYPAKATFMTDLTGATTTPQMISQALVDPFAANGTDYYKYSVNGRNYAVWSVGLDHASATADIDASGNVSSGGDDIVVTNGTIGAGGGGTPPGSIADHQPCVNSVDCASGTCTNGTCASNKLANGSVCGQNSDCQSGACGGSNPPTCLPTGGGASGVDTCGSGADCLSGYCGNCNYDFDTGLTTCSCTSGLVGTPCNYSNAQCQSGYCDGTKLNCSNGQSGVDGCSSGSQCQSGFCIAQKCSAAAGALGALCLDNQSCASTHCNSLNSQGHCTNGVTGVDTCGNAGACASGYCDNWNSKCSSGDIGQACYGGGNCSSGCCISNVCSASGLASGQTCTSGGCCQSGVCTRTGRFLRCQ